MSHIPVDQVVTHQTLLRSGRFCLVLSWGHTQLVHVVTGGAGHPFIGVNGLLPVQVLLVMALGKLVTEEVFDVPTLV